MNIYRCPPPAQAVALLAECGLPSSDLSDSSFQHFFGCGSERALDGVIGLEVHGEDALLRSLAVAVSARELGCGKALVEELEHFAHSQGVMQLYLLTETAEAFFERLGYIKVERNLVSNRIRETKEFASLCSDDATVMRKALACR